MAQPQTVDDGEIPLGHEGGDFKMPSLEEMLKTLENLQGLSDEDKEELRRSLMERAEVGGSGSFASPSAGGIQHSSGGLNVEFITLITFLSIITFIFVFFGYKLYKSLVEKERRRDEKRKQKQQKKKK